MRSRTRLCIAALAALGLLLSHGCKKGEAPPVPSDVSGPPADAKRTASGLAWNQNPCF